MSFSNSILENSSGGKGRQFFQPNSSINLIYHWPWFIIYNLGGKGSSGDKLYSAHNKCQVSFSKCNMFVCFQAGAAPSVSGVQFFGNFSLNFLVIIPHLALATAQLTINLLFKRPKNNSELDCMHMIMICGKDINLTRFCVWHCFTF